MTVKGASPSLLPSPSPCCWCWCCCWCSELGSCCSGCAPRASCCCRCLAHLWASASSSASWPSITTTSPSSSPPPLSPPPPSLPAAPLFAEAALCWLCHGLLADTAALLADPPDPRLDPPACLSAQPACSCSSSEDPSSVRSIVPPLSRSRSVAAAAAALIY